MKKLCLYAACAAIFLSPLATVYAAPPSNGAGRGRGRGTSRISAAIQDLESAVAYMENARIILES